MNNLKIVGRLTTVLPVEKFTSKGGKDYSSTTFAIETEGTYKKAIAFQDFGTAKVNEISIGTEIIVSFEPESREYNGKYYTNLKAYKIDKVAGVTNTSPPERKAETPSANTQSNGDAFADDRGGAASNGDDDGIPF